MRKSLPRQLPPSEPLIIDGKPLRKFLFAHKTFDGRGNAIFCAVEAFDKDHAVKRLEEAYPYKGASWDFLEELEWQHFMGGLGDELPYPVIIAKTPNFLQ